MRVLLIYNPCADHKKAKKLLPEVLDYFSEKTIDVDLKVTECPGNGTDIAQKADFTQYDGIVAAGGDGTLFEVINGIYTNASAKKIPLGVLPKGTGNAFVRDIELTGSEWKQAVDIIAQGKKKWVDVGHLQCEDSDLYFLNIMGFGFVTDVVGTAVKLKHFGNISYTLGVIYRTLFLKTYKLIIEVDGKRMERQNNFVEINNTRWASNFLMAPNAVMDDGYFDITLVNNISRRRLLKIFPKVFTGDHIYEPEVETLKAKKIHVQTATQKILSPDGELLGKTPFDVECLHKDMEVFWK